MSEASSYSQSPLRFPWAGTSLSWSSKHNTWQDTSPLPSPPPLCSPASIPVNIVSSRESDNDGVVSRPISPTWWYIFRSENQGQPRHPCHVSSLPPPPPHYCQQTAHMVNILFWLPVEIIDNGFIFHEKTCHGHTMGHWESFTGPSQSSALLLVSAPPPPHLPNYLAPTPRFYRW